MDLVVIASLLFLVFVFLVFGVLFVLLGLGLFLVFLIIVIETKVEILIEGVDELLLVVSL